MIEELKQHREIPTYYQKVCDNFVVDGMCRLQKEPIGNPDELPAWLKNIIRGNIEILKTIPDLDGQIHGQIQALEWVLSLRRGRS